MVTTNLDGFSLANRRRFAKFAKLSPRQTFLLYGISSVKLEIQLSFPRLSTKVIQTSLLDCNPMIIYNSPLAMTSESCLPAF